MRCETNRCLSKIGKMEKRHVGDREWDQNSAGTNEHKRARKMLKRNQVFEKKAESLLTKQGIGKLRDKRQGLQGKDMVDCGNEFEMGGFHGAERAMECCQREHVGR